MGSENPVSLCVNGAPVSASRRSSIAAAILACGQSVFRTSLSGEPRAPLCGMGICFECRATVDGRAHLRTCQMPCVEGADVRVPDATQAAVDLPDPLACGAEREKFDVLVIGAGPAGMAAASAATECGARTALVDDNPGPGGQIWRGLNAGPRQAYTPTGSSPWLSRLGSNQLTVFYGAAAVARPSAGTLLIEAQPGRAQESRIGPEEMPPRRKASSALLFEYDKLIVATGARERFLPFPGWTLPGVMGAGGLQALVKTGLDVRGARVVVAGSGPLLLAVAAYLKRARARVQLIAEQAPASRVRQFAWQLAAYPGKWLQALPLGWQLFGTAYRCGTWPVAAGGPDKLAWVDISDGQRVSRIACDYLACGFHLVPNIELAALIGCELDQGFARVDDWQQTSLSGTYCAGEPVAIGGLDAALIQGTIAGYAAAGHRARAEKYFAARRRARSFAGELEHAFRLREELRRLPAPDTIVCRCEDVTFQRLGAHTNWRSAKLQTRCGMGPCQGRVCGPAVHYLFDWEADSVRPPLFPVRAGSLIMSEV